MDKPQTETDYFYQDGAVLYTKDADGNRSSMNLLGTSANVIATSRGTGNSENWYLYNKDIRESTTSITGADGTAAATYEYDDFGNTMVTSGRNFDNEICYTGQIYDQSSGLYYYNARFYDPENARFLTQDTYRGEADQPDTLHLYAYCKNNPINYTDPTGHFVHALALTGGYVAVNVGVSVGACVICGAGAVVIVAAIIGIIYLGGKYYKKIRKKKHIAYSKGGRQNVRDSGLRGYSDSEVSRLARDHSLNSKERQRFIKEDKARKNRNKKKRRK